MRPRRAFVVAALALIIVAITIWISRRDNADTSQRATVAAEPRDETIARRLRAIHAIAAKRTPALPRYQLRGRVIDTAGSPVPDATVALGHPARQVRSGAAGEFAIADLPPGRYAVEARKGHLVGGPLAVQLGSDREVTLVLRRGAELRVEVVSATDGKPIANADVRISLLSMYDGGGEQQSRTDATGIAVFEGVTLVAHAVWIAAEGYVERTDAIDPMHVSGTTLQFRIELEPGVMVRGRVMDAETGRPIVGAVIEGISGDHREGARRGNDLARVGSAPSYAIELRGHGTRSDDEGRFRIGVSKGPWTIAASHPEYATTGGFIAVTDSPLEIQLSMTKGIVMRGVVVDEHDMPIAGAEVEARWQHGGRIERATRADGRGRFELAGLPAAPMEILARADIGTSAPRRFDLAEPLPDEDVLLVIDNTAAITGRVLRGPDPVAYGQVFCVEVNPRAKTHPVVANTDESGAFRIAGLAHDRMYALTAAPHQDGDAWIRSGHVEAKAGADVTIEIPADGSVFGRVEVAGGKLGDISVEIEGSTPPRKLERVGKFRFDNVPPGMRTLLFTGPRIADRRMRVELPPGANLDVGTVVLDPGRVLTGKVVGAKQEPIADAEVRVSAEGVSELATGTTHDGTFSLVVPADRELLVEARGRRGGMTSAVVPAKGVAGELVLRFAGDATVEGAITSGDVPVGEAIVQLRRAGMTGERPYAYTETDQSGYFRLVALEPGSYELHMTRTDPTSSKPVVYTKQVEIKAGANYANTDLAQLTPR